MKQIQYIILAWVIGLLNSCSNFDDINTNPDASTKVNSALLATGAIKGAVTPEGGISFVEHSYITKYMAWGEGPKDQQYNLLGRISFGGYTSLKDYETMVELATDEYKSAYEGLALLLKAMYLFDLTIRVGDIPYSEILKGKEGIINPKYDNQKDVCLAVLADLDNAYSKLISANNFDGDFVYSGNVEQWAKLAATYQLRVLMTLSKKESDTDLQIKERFKKVYDTYSLMSSNADNFQLTFSTKAGQWHPFNSGSLKHWEYPMLSDFFINMLKENEDYRLFYFANPAQKLVDDGVSASSWDAFIGIDPVAPVSDIRTHFSNKTFCGLNNRYVHYQPGEPSARVNYSELNFILAEAALRGWINADASTFYKKGIEANMQFILTYTPEKEEYHHGNPMSDEYITAFLEKPSIQLTGSFENKLEMLMKQKYIAAFLQIPYQPYYDYRRTGYPVLPSNPETSFNFNAPDKVPVRWLYPTQESEYNSESLEEALSRQYGGTDEINKLMWILQ